MCCLLLAFTSNYTEALKKKTSVMKLVNLRGFYLVFQYKDIYWNLQIVHISKIFLVLHKNQNIKSKKKKKTNAVLGSAKATGIHTIVISGKECSNNSEVVFPHCSSSFVPSASGHRSARQSGKFGQTDCAHGWSSAGGGDSHLWPLQSGNQAGSQDRQPGA